MKVFLKFIAFGIVGFITVSCALLAINYYFYSWTSFIQPFGCEEKRIQGEKFLAVRFDIDEIASQLRQNPNYEIEPLKYYRGFSVVRKFEEVSYEITLIEEKNSETLFQKVHFSNYPIRHDEKPVLEKGELGTTPTYYVKKNIDQMIDEMPLNDAQKNELKNNVTIRCWSSFSLAYR